MAEGQFPPGAAIVVGGSGGIGKAICLRLAERGCDIAFTFRRNAAAAGALASQLSAAGVRAHSRPLDLGDRQAVRTFCDEVGEALGRPHTLVLAAGADISMTYVADVDHAEWDRTIAGDLTGTFNMITAVLPQLRAGGGSITAITSAGLRRHPPKDILSVVPKAGIEALIRGVAREEGRFGIRANAVALGVIDTGLFDRLRDRVTPQFVEAMKQNTSLRRFGTADEAAAAVAFLASSDAAYITGQSLAVDGGFSV